MNSGDQEQKLMSTAGWEEEFAQPSRFGKINWWLNGEKTSARSSVGS